MDIAVLGAGAIGGTMAALLHRSGHAVTVTARGDQLQAIKTNGLTLAGEFGEFTAACTAQRTLDRKPELAIVTTKAQNSTQIIIENFEYLDGVPVIVVQNGLQGVRTAEPLLPASSVIGAVTSIGARNLEPGTVTVTSAEVTRLGKGFDGPPQLAIQLAAVLDHSFPTVAIDNFAGALWTKLVVNQVNALPAITGMTIQESIANPVLLRVLVLSMQEAVAVAKSIGVKFAGVQGVTEQDLRHYDELSVEQGTAIPQAIANRMGPVPNYGSTLQSIKRGIPTEIDYLNGEIVAVAKHAGLDALLNALLTRLVHIVESTGTYLKPEDVSTRCDAVLHDQRGSGRHVAQR